MTSFYIRVQSHIISNISSHAASFVVGLATILLYILCGHAISHSAPLSTSLSSESIHISHKFNGKVIDVIGNRDDINSHVIISMEGPAMTKRVFMKEKNGFNMWVNSGETKFTNVPSAYFLLSNEDVSSLLNEKDIDELHLNIHSIDMQGSSNDDSPEHIAQSKETILQYLKTHNLWKENTTSGIVYANGKHLFRGKILIPSTITAGEYTVTTYLVENHKVVATNVECLDVQKTGLTSFITTLATKYVYLYALCNVIIAIFMGFIMSVIVGWIYDRKE